MGSLSVGVNMLRSLLSFLLLSLTSSLPQQDGVSHDFMGFDTGNPEADFEAGMWTAALIGTLMAAVPVALLNPSLGFKRRRRAVVTTSREFELENKKFLDAIISNI